MGTTMHSPLTLATLAKPKLVCMNISREGSDTLHAVVPAIFTSPIDIDWPHRPRTAHHHVCEDKRSCYQ